MDIGKIKSLSSALRDALLSSRPARAQPGAGAADGHEAAHPGNKGVIVELSGSGATGKPAERLAQAARSGLPLEVPAREARSGRDTERLSRALRVAHSGMPGPAARALARGEDRSVSGFGAPEAAAEEAAANPPVIAARAQAAGAGNPGALPAGSIAPEASARTDAFAAQLAAIATGAAAANLAQTEQIKAAPPPAQRAVPELITPFLVRQEPAEAPAPYLNQLIVGAALLGLVMLLVF